MKEITYHKEEDYYICKTKLNAKSTIYKQGL